MPGNRRRGRPVCASKAAAPGRLSRDATARHCVVASPRRRPLMLVSALASSRIEDVNLWDRDNKLGAPITNMAYLLVDFLWKHWPGSVDRVNRLDRDIHPVATVLMRVVAYRKI